MANINPPIGADKKFLVRCNGNPFAGFDTAKDAEQYIEMHKTKLKPGKKEPAYAATCNWSVEER
jgi:hypothetical protein